MMRYASEFMTKVDMGDLGTHEFLVGYKAYRPHLDRAAPPAICIADDLPTTFRTGEKNEKRDLRNNVYFSGLQIKEIK